MPVLIVDDFQAVHIEEHHAEGSLCAARTVEFRFQHADETAIVCQTGQRIADRHGAYLLEQARLVQQSPGEHHHIAERFAQFRKKEGSIKKLARKRRGHVADRVQRSHDKQRVVEKARAAFFVLFILDALAEAGCRGQIKRRGKQVPGTRQDVFCIRHRRRGGSKKRGTRQVRG